MGLVSHDLREVCRTLLDDLSLRSGRAIALEVPALPVRMHIDRERLNQVMTTVVRHALKRSSPDGTVQVCVSQNQERILIQVRDTEPDRAQEQHLPSSSIESPPIATDLVAGDDTDLWLVICKTIVEWYNGHLQYTAYPDERGNTCIIELPAYP